MTTSTPTNALISARILALVAAGVDLPAAMDQVLGAGTYERVAGELYDALRVRSA